jgi:hypothetical protein
LNQHAAATAASTTTATPIRHWVELIDARL